MNWRNHFPVLVVEAQAMGSLAVIRSLGRGGYPVHACSYRADAMGLQSRFTLARVVSPGYRNPDFIDWLSEYIREHDIRAIIPSEDLLLALRPVYSEFARFLPCSDQEEIVFAGMSKFDLFQSLLGGTAADTQEGHLPPTLLIRDFDHLPSRSELGRLGRPLYIKVDGCYSKRGEDGQVLKAPNVDEAYALLNQLGARYNRAVVQGYVPGRGVGAFFLRWKGRLLAEFMHRRLHEVPPSGGVSSLRASWRHQSIRNDALAKLNQMRWDGVAMMEYRWDPDGDRFFLMEMNGRFWGSLHLALFAGVDFPLLLLDAFHGRPQAAEQEFPVGVRARWTFPREVQYVWSRLRDRQLPWTSRIWSVLEFFLLALDPRVRSDYLFPGDRKLHWESVKRFFAKDFARAREVEERYREPRMDRDGPRGS